MHVDSEAPLPREKQELGSGSWPVSRNLGYDLVIVITKRTWKMRGAYVREVVLAGKQALVNSGLKSEYGVLLRMFFHFCKTEELTTKQPKQ